MDFSIRQVDEKDCSGPNGLFEEIDEYHRKALPHIFKKPDGPVRNRDFLSGIHADRSAK
jgi:hypothetical protein